MPQPARSSESTIRLTYAELVRVVDVFADGTLSVKIRKEFADMVWEDKIGAEAPQQKQSAEILQFPSLRKRIKLRQQRLFK